MPNYFGFYGMRPKLPPLAIFSILLLAPSPGFPGPVQLSLWLLFTPKLDLAVSRKFYNIFPLLSCSIPYEQIPALKTSIFLLSTPPHALESLFVTPCIGVGRRATQFVGNAVRHAGFFCFIKARRLWKMFHWCTDMRMESMKATGMKGSFRGVFLLFKG